MPHQGVCEHDRRSAFCTFHHELRSMLRKDRGHRAIGGPLPAGQKGLAPGRRFPHPPWCRTDRIDHNRICVRTPARRFRAEGAPRGRPSAGSLGAPRSRHTHRRRLPSRQAADEGSGRRSLATPMLLRGSFVDRQVVIAATSASGPCTLGVAAVYRSIDAGLWAGRASRPPLTWFGPRDHRRRRRRGHGSRPLPTHLSVPVAVGDVFVDRAAHGSEWAQYRVWEPFSVLTR
ncbi:Uncharacterised protein [Prescottella equi]|nr:Uncharacterised protein [Prescottella equi]SUE21510.1 Uncharacterised protein [Prescottella equi]